MNTRRGGGHLFQVQPPNTSLRRVSPATPTPGSSFSGPQSNPLWDRRCTLAYHTIPQRSRAPTFQIRKQSSASTWLAGGARVCPLQGPGVGGSREVLRARVPGDGRKGCLSHPLPTHAPALTGDPHHPRPLCQDPLIVWWEFRDRQAMRMGGGFGPSCHAVHQDCRLGQAKD